uniref:Small ribosomal subunit protein uS5m n=1 Tax=Anopheles melas TaxID=34690 RepID=A0A182TS38_9DIPT
MLLFFAFPVPADQIWKGVISVSNAGKKRGRGKGSGRITPKDLNKGQMIGYGKANIVWPGLSAPVIRGRELVQQQKLPEDKEREAKLRRIRDEMVNFKRLKLSPLERGWSGSKMPGRSIGPPDAVGEDEFIGFDTKCLELKAVVNMKGNHGRKRRVSAMVVTGNGNGLAGFGFGKAIEGRAALRQAKNRAGQKLMHFELCNGHTVFHDFHCQFGATKLFVERKPEGYGLKCHRAIRTVCEVLGIKDLRAKCEGSTNVQHVVKAFFIGLLKQKDHQRIAEEKGLHVVEFRPENMNFPKVVASPTVCRTEQELENNEILDFTQYCMDGKIQLQKKKFPPFYTKFRSWEIYLKKQDHGPAATAPSSVSFCVIMPWYAPWSDVIKKKICRFLLQRYLGRFLEEKLTLDQLNVDFYNGTGTVHNVTLYCQTRASRVKIAGRVM